MSTTPLNGRTILEMSILPDTMDSVWVEVSATKDGQRYTYRAAPQQLFDTLNIPHPTIDDVTGLVTVLEGLRNDLNRLTLYTAVDRPIEAGGRALLPSRPLGSFTHNLAIVTLNDGSVVEMTHPLMVEEEGSVYVQLQPDDYALYTDTAVAITVSYLTQTPLSP